MEWKVASVPCATLDPNVIYASSARIEPWLKLVERQSKYWFTQAIGILYSISWKKFSHDLHIPT